MLWFEIFIGPDFDYFYAVITLVLTSTDWDACTCAFSIGHVWKQIPHKGPIDSHVSVVNQARIKLLNLCFHWFLDDEIQKNWQFSVFTRVICFTQFSQELSASKTAKLCNIFSGSDLPL